MDPNRAYAKLLEAGNEWADRNAAAQLLEETRKSVRSEIAQEYKRRDNLSAIEAERMAEASSEYRQHVERMVNARKAANRARVAYDGIRALIDMRRTQAATAREEARLAGTQL